MTAATQAAPLSRAEYGRLVDRARVLVGETVPPGGVVAVVSRGDPGLVELEGRDGWHFPQESSGVYSGHHPADSADAIAQLEAIREKGAGFLLVPSTASWWFDHYRDFKRHLDRYPLLAQEADTCALYALSGEAGEDTDPAGFGPLRRQALARQIEDIVSATLPDDAHLLLLGGSGLAFRRSFVQLQGLSATEDGFLVVPVTDFHELDERPGLSRQRLVVDQRHVCRIYELAAPPARRRRSLFGWFRRA